MADNWQGYPDLAETPADGDTVLVRDISNTTDNAAGTNVEVTHLNFIGSVLAVLRSSFTPASASAPASLDLHEDTDNGAHRVRITAPAALGADRALTVPDADGTLARTADITFETLSAAGDVGTGAAQVAAGDHAHPASAITSGTLVHERGGLEADVSAFDGVPRITGGATSALALGIANDALLQAKNTAASGEFARFTTAGIEGLTEAELKAAANLEIGTDVQAWDAQLDTWATVTPSANGQSLVASATYATMRGLLDLEAGTDFYSISAADAKFTDTANAPGANEFARFTDATTIEGRTAAETRADLDLEPGTDFYSISAANAAFQPIDADLTALAAAGNSTVLSATTASFLTADETKLDGIEALADVTDATNVAAAGALMTGGGTMTGAVTLGTGGSIVGGDKVASALEIKDVGETAPAEGSIGGTVTRSFAVGGVQDLTLTSNVTSLAISNPPASGIAGTITFIVNHGSGPFTWAHPTGIKWPGAVAPTMSSGASDISIVSYMTRDGGTTWYGFFSGADFS